MKTKIELIAKNISFMILLVSLFTSCAKNITFLNSAVVPAAEGTVSIKQDNNKNYNIDLTVNQLADPGRLTPPKAVYVVWMESSESGVQNIGQLKTSKKGFSRMLSSSLKTVTPHKPTGFFITAEDDATGNYPGMTVVLKTGPLGND
jgi:hypothetical protein